MPLYYTFTRISTGETVRHADIDDYIVRAFGREPTNSYSEEFNVLLWGGIACCFNGTFNEDIFNNTFKDPQYRAVARDVLAGTFEFKCGRT